jgi:hypothetical protein
MTLFGKLLLRTFVGIIIKEILGDVLISKNKIDIKIFMAY